MVVRIRIASALQRTHLLLLLVGLLGSMPYTATAQHTSPADSSAHQTAIHRVMQAFEEGMPEALFTPAADRIDVSLLGSRSYYSQSQAFYVMRDYFRHHAPRSFSVDRTAEADASLFVMGTYHHAQADTPVYVMVRFDEDATTWVLHEVRIETASP
jgi:hypothetical protein